MPIIAAFSIVLPTICFTVVAQDSESVKLRQVEQTILDVTFPETYGDEFIKQGLSVCRVYNELTYEEKISASEDVNKKYDEVMSRVAFVIQQNADKLITSQQPMSELFQPTMELNSKIAQLQWNYQQKISNLEEFERLRIGLRESYLNDEFIPNYYIRDEVEVAEDEFLNYQQMVELIEQEPVPPQPTVSESTSIPIVDPNPPEFVPVRPSSDWNANTSLPIMSSNQTNNVVNPSEISTSSSGVTSEEVSSSEPTSSAVSEITSSNETLPTVSESEKVIPTKSPSPSTLDSYEDINLVVVYVVAAVGVLTAVGLGCFFVWKSEE